MNSLLVQPFVQLKRRPNEAVTWTAGLHAMYDTRSGAYSLLEPRLGIQYVTEGGVVWSAGSGLHSQTQSPYIYASATATEATGPLNMPNQNLGFNKSLHTVVGMTKRLKELWTVKMEAYHQHLFNIPIADLNTEWGEVNGSYSLINAGGGFSRLFPDTLVNGGVGRKRWSRDDPFKIVLEMDGLSYLQEVCLMLSIKAQMESGATQILMVDMRGICLRQRSGSCLAHLV